MNNLIVPAGSLSYPLLDQNLWLLPQKAIYWQEQATLMVADLHLGKAGHFRKAGIPVPSAIHQDDLSALKQLLHVLPVRQVLMLGDLFHSSINREWYDFVDLLEQHSDLPFVLVKGNHDILPAEAYQLKNLRVVQEALSLPPFYLTHQPAFGLPGVPQEGFFMPGSNTTSLYNLSGHVHPGVSLQDALGHRFQMPCFYFMPEGGILPAFGKFTGFKSLKKNKQSRIFGITPSSRRSAGKVIHVS